MVRGVDEPRGGWERFEVPATEMPRISASFLQEEALALPRRIYRQEYECSFEATEDQVFSLEDVDNAMSTAVTPSSRLADDLLFGVGPRPIQQTTPPCA